MFPLMCAWINDMNKQSWGWWFETPSRSLWRHCNALLNDKCHALTFHNRACYLAAIVGTIILMSCHVVNSLQLFEEWAPVDGIQKGIWTIALVVTGHNGHKPKRPQPERPQTGTATNRNGHKPKRPQAGTATNRNGHKPKRPQTETVTNRNGHKRGRFGFGRFGLWPLWPETVLVIAAIVKCPIWKIPR